MIVYFVGFFVTRWDTKILSAGHTGIIYTSLDNIVNRIAGGRDPVAKFSVQLNNSNRSDCFNSRIFTDWPGVSNDGPLDSNAWWVEDTRPMLCIVSGVGYRNLHDEDVAGAREDQLYPNQQMRRGQPVSIFVDDDRGGEGNGRS